MGNGLERICGGFGWLVMARNRIVEDRVVG